jgi:hypothetical protein
MDDEWLVANECVATLRLVVNEGSFGLSKKYPCTGQNLCWVMFNFNLNEINFPPKKELTFLV